MLKGKKCKQKTSLKSYKQSIFTLIYFAALGEQSGNKCRFRQIFVEALEELPKHFIQSKTSASTHEQSRQLFGEENRGLSPVLETGFLHQLVLVLPTGWRISCAKRDVPLRYSRVALVLYYSRVQLTIILRNRAEYRLILSRRGRRPP